MDAKTESHSSQDATACVEAFSADGAANRSNNVRGGTVQDKKDMWRIGRHQELNVRRRSETSVLYDLSDGSLEKF